MNPGPLRQTNFKTEYSFPELLTSIIPQKEHRATIFKAFVVNRTKPRTNENVLLPLCGVGLQIVRARAQPVSQIFLSPGDKSRQDWLRTVFKNWGIALVEILKSYNLF